MTGTPGIRHRSLCGIFFLLLLVAGCADQAPTAIEKDPLAGKWSGTFTRSTGQTSKPGEMQIVVRAGGDVIGTGVSFYSSPIGPVADCLVLDLIIGPDGEVAGTGTHEFLVFNEGVAYVTSGPVDGSFDAVTYVASGTVYLDLGPDGTFSIQWSAAKLRNSP